jgi:hypothetical protein
MKPWEDEKTVRQFQRMSANKSIKSAADLIKFSLEILISSIKEDHPRIKPAQLRKEMQRILYWEEFKI